jgi:hypothetical protein
MKFQLRALLSLLAGLAAPWSQAQPFVGTNSPGQTTNYTFTLTAGATNLSLVVSNSTAAYSWLYVTNGGVPPTINNYEFTSRLVGLTNQINLEAPEFATGTYHLLVYTPSASTSEAFSVALTTNRPDLRSASYPVSKPLVFSTTGYLTNSGAGAWQYFQVDVPSNLLTGWRIVVSSTNATPPYLYIRQGQLPTTGVYDVVSYGTSIDTVTYNSTQAVAGTYFIGVYLPAGTDSSANYVLGAELASVTALTWDPGTNQPGTQVYNNQSTTGGDYYFSILTETTANGVWRNALNVQSGQASLYLLNGSLPTTNFYDYASARTGSNGFVLAQGEQFTPGQNWYILVHATPNAQWNLVSGQAYVQQLPPLASDNSSGVTNTMGAEGMAFFQTTIPTGTLAWRLDLPGLANQLYVKSTLAPVPYNTDTYDLTQAGQMLVVPTYLSPGNQYFVGVAGNPGLLFNLDSRQQAVTSIPFTWTNTITVNPSDYGYLTFLVEIPVQQIAWEVDALPSLGAPGVAVRSNNVPNEFVNDAVSDISGGVGNSLALVPPTLTDGSFYVTVYGTPPFNCSLVNGQPVITPVNYVFAITNDAPNRVGWRYYSVTNVAEQLNSLGWELDLTNPPAGFEIALRRNAVPGAWNYRNNPYDSYSDSSQSYVDLSSTLDYLQQPGHPADVWYLGIYSPAAVLGNFILAGSQLTGPPINFDGTGNLAKVTNQPAGKYQYFTYTVPANTVGWDLRLTNVTSGSPYIMICRDELPPGNNGYWTPWESATWPSGYDWEAGGDWTGDNYDANGADAYGQILEMGMGNPLQAGTYYVGVIGFSGSAPMTYSLMSRGIGPGFTIPITPLAFTNGAGNNIVINPGLAPREAAYYQLTVPPNATSWRVELDTNIGDSLLLIQQNALPNENAGNQDPYYLEGGREMNKSGDQQYLMMPNNYSASNYVAAGTYYLAVVGEGVNPSSGYSTGTGLSSYTLGSYGSLDVTNMGTVDPTGLTDLRETNNLSLAGQMSAYSFSVPANTLSLEIYLTNTTGSPYMTLLTGSQLPAVNDIYGNNGGASYAWNSSTVISIPNPAVTNYTLMVQAEQEGGNASYIIDVHAIGAQTVAFDGGTATIINQLPDVWQFFNITVPANALGWDVRLTNVSAPNDLYVQPILYICRDFAPTLSSPYYWSPQDNASWPSGYEWQAGWDWTGEEYDPNGGEGGYGRTLEMGMGNPLSPGNYYLGVYNNTSSTNQVSYTLVSRGIGPGFTIPVTPLAFTNGAGNNVVSVAGLAPREVAYYQLTVPPNATSWRVELDTNIGQSLLLIQQNALPNVDAGTQAPYYLEGGREMDKPGDQQYLMMPNNYSASNYVVAGTYYLAVVGEGVNPSGSTIGTGSSSYTLGSYGSLDVTNMGTVDPTGLTDLRETNNLSLAGQMSAYSFSVPANTLSLEIYLTNITGSPYMTLAPGNQLPAGYDGYGNNGGAGYSWNSSTLINIANPAATNYTLMVQAEQEGGNASYIVDVHAIGAQTVAFDGGTATIINQPPDVWEYFYITVPANAVGWDARLTNVSAPNDLYVQPILYICRDFAPTLSSPYYWSPQYNATWPSGYEWAAGWDWTGEEFDANGGEGGYGRIMQMGMGNPLSPGNYYLGVYNNTSSTNQVSYTLVSRGIGPGFTIPVTPLAFSNGVAANVNGLNPRQVDYYQVTVPTNAPSWQIQLSNVTGETLLMLQQNALPNEAAGGQSPNLLEGGREMEQPGNEQYLLLPNYSYSNYVVAGTYYLGVVSQGVNPSGSTIGSNSSFYTLTSYGPQGITNLGTVGPVGMDIYQTNAVPGGGNALYQFTIPPGMPAVEVRLDNVTASPYMTMQTGSNIIAPYGSYGNNGGAFGSWSSPSIITLPNPTATNYSLTVQAYYNNVADAYINADFTVHIRQMPIPALAFDPSLNNYNNGVINTASGVLEAGQSAFYEVTVPASLGESPILGWVLSLTQSSGAASVSVRPGEVPDGVYCDSSSPLVANQGIYVAPYLTPGTWYVQVYGNTAASYTLTSQALELNRPAWTMPAVGGAVTTPGLPPGGPLFADTGVEVNGTQEGGDGGSDLAEGAFDYYEIIVPTTNTGVLRTRLDALSGNPNLYIRAGAPPTLSHYSSGNCGGTLYDRSLSPSSGSAYGNWVPLDGRHQAYLTSGAWYLAVQAAGGSNVRYRLRMDTGSISNLSLNGGSYTSQEMAAGDWLYYNAFIPTNAPVDWNVTFSTQLGDVVMYVRDTSPPGQATTTSDLRDWNSDNKNHGPYPNFTSPGTYTLTTPPLRPGNTYYLGFYAQSDSTFSISDSTNGGYINYTNTLPFYGGYTTNQIPAFGQLKFRIDVPADATEWIDTSVHSANVWLFLDQGSAPTLTTSDDWYSENYANGGLDYSLENTTSWPWLPGYSYFLNVTNTSGSTQPFSFSMFGVYPEAGRLEFISALVLNGNGGFVLNMMVNPGWTYQLQVSTDLINWTVLTTFTPTSTPYTFTDTGAPGYTYRFYRLVVQ